MVQPSAVENYSVQLSTVWCSRVQFSAGEYSAVQQSTVQCSSSSSSLLSFIRFTYSDQQPSRFCTFSKAVVTLRKEGLDGSKYCQYSTVRCSSVQRGAVMTVPLFLQIGISSLGTGRSVETEVGLFRLFSTSLQCTIQQVWSSVIFLQKGNKLLFAKFQHI